MRWLTGIALVVIALTIPFVVGCDNKPTTPKDGMAKDRMTTTTDRMDPMGKDKMDPMGKDKMDPMAKDKMAPDKDKMGK